MRSDTAFTSWPDAIPWAGVPAAIRIEPDFRSLSGWRVTETRSAQGRDWTDQVWTRVLVDRGGRIALLTSGPRGTVRVTLVADTDTLRGPVAYETRAPGAEAAGTPPGDVLLAPIACSDSGAAGP